MIYTSPDSPFAPRLTPLRSPLFSRQTKEYELARVFNPSLSRAPERRYRTGSIPTTPELEENRDQEVSNEIIPATTPTTTTTTTTTEATKHVLINTIVDKFRKKFKNNRNGRKMARKCDEE